MKKFRAHYELYIGCRVFIDRMILSSTVHCMYHFFVCLKWTFFYSFPYKNTAVIFFFADQDFMCYHKRPKHCLKPWSSNCNDTAMFRSILNELVNVRSFLLSNYWSIERHLFTRRVIYFLVSRWGTQKEQRFFTVFTKFNLFYVDFAI